MAARGIFIISQLSAGIAGAGAPAGDVSGENGERYPASRPGRRRARPVARGRDPRRGDGLAAVFAGDPAV